MKKFSQSNLKIDPPKGFIEEIKTEFEFETLSFTLKTLRKIGSESNKYLKQLKNLETQFKKIANIFNKLEKDNKEKNINNIVKDKNLQSILIKWEIVLKNSYSFIQKTRKFFTGEELQYIILFDEKQFESRLGVFPLETIISVTSLEIDFKYGINIRFSEQEKLKSLYDSLKKNETISEELEGKILKKFDRILEERYKMYNNIEKDSTLSEEEKKKKLSEAYTNRGFSAEEAIRIVDSGLSLIKSYKLDRDAFWRGGDLQRDIDRIPQELLDRYENANFEVKRLSATAKNSIGANLSSLNGLITALAAIKNISSNKNLQKDEIKEFMNKFLFKTDANIKRSFSESIANKTGKELENIFKDISKWGYKT